MTKGQATMARNSSTSTHAGHSSSLAKDLKALGKALQSRPVELRGPFSVRLSEPLKSSK